MKEEQGNVTEEEQENNDFDAGWDEGEGGSASDQGNDDSTAAGSVSGNDDDHAQEALDGGDEGKEGGSGDEMLAQPDDQAAGDQDPDYKELYEKERQRTKSWEGRLSKADLERNAMAKELEDLKKRLGSNNAPEDGQDSNGEEANDAADGEISAVGDKFREEYGDEIADQIERHALEAKTQAEKAVLERLKPLEEVQQRLAMEEHFSAIRNEHPDYEELAASDEFVGWVKNHPEPVVNAMSQIIQQGSADQVNELLASYKTAVNAKKSTAEKRENRARRSAAVAGGRSAARPPKAVDKNDFDGAWDSF